MTRNTLFKDMESPCKIRVYKKDFEKVWLLIRKWDTTDEWDPVSVSYSTYNLFKYEYPECLDEDTEDLGISADKFKYIHYHELVIRAGKFSRISQYKKLKIKHMRYNMEIFNSLLSTKELVCFGNYADDADFKDLANCGGYHSQRSVVLSNGERTSLLMMQFGDNGYNMFNSSDMRQDDPYMFSCMVHEMCHGYVDAIHGTNWETEGSAGYNILGLSREKYGKQIECHGKRFADACAMAAEKTGYPIQFIFNYGTTGDDFIKAGYPEELTRLRETEWTKGLKFNRENGSMYADTDALRGYEYLNRSDNKAGEGFLRLKDEIIKYAKNIKKDVYKVYKVRMAIKATKTETRIGIQEQDGKIVEYDINADYNNGVAAYRMRSSKKSAKSLKDFNGIRIYSDKIDEHNPSGQAEAIVEAILKSYL